MLLAADVSLETQLKLVLPRIQIIRRKRVMVGERRSGAGVWVVGLSYDQIALPILLQSSQLARVKIGQIIEISGPGKVRTLGVAFW